MEPLFYVMVLSLGIVNDRR